VLLGKVLNKVKTLLKLRIETVQERGSGKTFNKFIDLVCRLSIDKNKLPNFTEGGKHDFSDDDAIDDNCSSSGEIPNKRMRYDCDFDKVPTEHDMEFIDDTGVPLADASNYLYYYGDQIRREHDQIISELEELGYPANGDALIDDLSDSDENEEDENKIIEQPASELNDHEKKSFDRMKCIINDQIISPNNTDGLCIYYSILNGFHFKNQEKKIEFRISEDNFKSRYSDVYKLILPYKEKLRFC